MSNTTPIPVTNINFTSQYTPPLPMLVSIPTKLYQSNTSSVPVTYQLRTPHLFSSPAPSQNRNTARSISTNSITSSLPSSPASSSSQNKPIPTMNRRFSSASVVPENLNRLSPPPQLTGSRRQPNDRISSIPPRYPSSREHSMEFDGVHYSCREVRRGGKRSTKKKIQKKKRVHFSKKGKKTRR